MTYPSQPMAENYNLKHTKKRQWKRFVTFLAAVVVFCTTYALIIPAITWEKSLICEQEEHQHSEECYQTVEIPAEMQLICEKAEHVHTEECLSETRVLSCGLEESEEHTHTDECYTTETAYICGQEEHSHDESCYTETEARTKTTLICEKEEHVHGTDCYDAPPAAAENPYFCGQIAHTHDESCYFEDGTLKCTIEEHVHTAECEIDPNAVSETEEVQFEEAPSEGPVEENVLTAETTTMAAISTINAFSSDGAEVIITGVLPEGAEARIDAVALSEEELIAYFGEAKAAAMKDFVAYDIKIMVDGEEWQPDESVSVVVKEPAITVEEDENFAVAHVDSETEEVSEVDAAIDENGEVSFEAEGFSIYIFYTFTVDFHFGDVTFSINGRTNILLSELFAELGIEFDAADAVNVVFSDDSLLAVEQVEGDWLLTSLEAFDTHELLTVTFADGEILVIDTFDAATTYWQKVTSIDDTSANYLIVNNSSGWALGANSDGSEKHVSANMSPVSGHDGYYSTTLTNEYWWKLSGTNGTQTNVAYSSYGIKLGYNVTNPISAEKSTNVLTYNSETGFWTISREGRNSTYYLRYIAGNSSIESSTLTNYTERRNTVIYKQVSLLPEETPDAPAYYQRVSSIDANADHYLIVSVEGNYALKTGDSPYCSQVELAPVKGNPGYFEVSGVVNTMKWKFGTNGGSGSSSSVYNQSDNSIALRLGNSYFYGSATNLSRTYDAVNGTWTLANSSNYLINDNGEFKSSNSTDSTFRRNLLILKPVATLPSVIPEDVPGGSSVPGSGGTETYPGDLTVTTPSEAKTGTDTYNTGLTMTYDSDPGTSDIENRFVSMGVVNEIDLKSISATVNGNTNERYPNLFDDSTDTKYCAGCSDINSIEVVFETNDGSAQTVTDYKLTTANDHEKYKGRLPKGWKLYGSNDQSSWHLIDTVSDPGMEEINYKEYAYETDVPGSYRYYKIAFDVQGVNTLQLSEIKFYTGSAAANDGKILADKSVLYGDNDYYNFGSYASDEFSVTLSALAQQYSVKGSETEYTPIDVVLVLDISGSMKQIVGDQTRAKTLTTATNTLIEKIMSYHPDNRVGIVTFSNSSQELLPLNRYYVGDWGTEIDYNKTDPYEYLKCDVTYKDGKVDTTTISTNPNLRYAGTNKKFNSGTQLSREVVGGTYTQQGIAQGAGVFYDVTDRTVTLSSGDSVSRTPLMILVSDGEPTICTSNYMDPLAGPHYGSGVASKTSNDKGVLGYYTILTANYFKSMIGIHYDTPARMYTIGMGILQTGTGNAATASDTVTGDHYKRAVLNPSGDNIDALINETGAKNYSTTAKQLADLLSDSYSGSNITISSASDSGIISVLGRTNAVVPVLKNPYKDSYAYADGAYFKEDYDPSALIAVFDSIVKNTMQSYECNSAIKGNTSLTFVDTIGDGMQLTSAPVLRYGNATYMPTPSTAPASGSTTYTYTGRVTPSAYAGSESLSQITVTVSGTPGEGQKITWNIPADLVPEFTQAQTADWYYPQYPARLLFKVGLTDDAKAELNALPIGETRTFYTNSTESAANAKYAPSENNPYYQTNRSNSLIKTENTSETAATYFESTHASGTVITALGNNGRLVFTKGGTPPTGETIPVHNKVIDAFRDGDDNPDTELDNTASDLTDLYRLYLNVGPETAYSAVDVMFIIDSSTSMSGHTGFDSTDILGKYKTWRCWALDTLLFGEPSNASPVGSNVKYENGGSIENNNKQHQRQLCDNGLIAKIAALNPANKVAIARFSDTSDVLLDWTRAGAVETDSIENYNNKQGTNYVAGLQEAIKFLNDDDVKNDGNKKVMIFISDGLPTKYYSSLSSTNLGGSGSERETEFNVTKEVIEEEFKPAVAELINSGNLEIFSIAVGNGKFATNDGLDPRALLKLISTNNSSFDSTNFQQILYDLDNKITRGAGRYSHLKITDTLSKYVDFYSDKDLADSPDLDLVVQVIPDSSTTGTGTILYKDGKLTTEGEKYIKPLEDGGVVVDFEKKTVSVEFLENYKEEGGYKYSVSFNVKTTQTAYDEFAENMADNIDGYGNVKGDINTDYTFNGNETSSNKPGFYSNASATLEYTQTHEGEKPIEYCVPYDDPVIQVAAKDIKIRKTDMSGKILTGTGSSAVFEVYEDAKLTVLHDTYTTEDGETIIRDLSIGKTYYLVETKAPDGYNILPYKVAFTVNAAGKIRKITEEGSMAEFIGDAYISIDEDGVTLKVKNSSGYSLPETGGIGTTVLYICGGVMFLGAAVLLAKKRRKDFI